MNGLTLYGAEEVLRAGHNISHAADDMLRSANIMSDCVMKLEQLFGQGYGSNLDRLIEALESRKSSQESN